MKKIIIWLMALLGGIIVIVVAAVVLIPQFVDIESYKPEIEKKVAEVTGRTFTLGGDLQVSVFPWVGVSFTELHLGNFQGFETDEFVKIRSFKAKVKLLPLLSKKLEIKEFVVDGAEITLEKAADGRVSWLAPAKEHEPATGIKQDKGTEPQQGGAPLDLSFLNSLSVEEFAVVNGRISYVDKSLGTKQEVTGITFKLEDISLDRPVGMLFQADIDGKPVAIQGTFGPIGRQIGRETVNVDLAIDIIDQLKMSLNGTIDNPIEQQKFDFNLRVEPFSPRQLLAAFDRQMPMATTDPGVLNQVTLQLQLQGDPTQFFIKNSSVNVDDSIVKIEATVKNMEQPDISFRIDLDAIDLDRYLPPPSEKTATTQGAPTVAATGAGAGAAEKPPAIDYAPLRQLLIDGEIAVGQLVAHGGKVQNFSMKIKGNDGIFTLDPFRLDLYQGVVAVAGTFDVQGDKPQAEVRWQADKIAVGPLLRETMEKDIIEGTLTAAGTIRFSGDDGTAVKKSLNGKGNLNFIDGALVGIDLAEMARNVSSSFTGGTAQQKPRTDFAEFDVPFTLTDGVMQTLNTRLASPFLRLATSGTADFVTEKLNFKVKPTVVATLTGQGDSKNRQGITVPILVTGTFAKPEYSADLTEIVSRKTLEDAAKDPEGTAKKAKALRDTGRQLFKSLRGGD